MDAQGFDSELQTYFKDVKAEIKRDHSKYLAKHPELREILNDFLSTVMLEKPADVYEYASQYFSYYNIDKDKIYKKPLVISGPSGSGKGTIVRKIMEIYPDLFQISISYTTRKPLLSETHGVEYFFVSREEFLHEIERNSFCEYSEYQGEYYGTHKGKLDSIISAQKIAILEIDVEGAKNIYKNNSEWNYIFLNAPSLDELKKRMTVSHSRQPSGATTTIKTENYINERLKIAEQEIEQQKKASFFHLIINEDMEMCIEELQNYLRLKYGDIDQKLEKQ